jgi:hypothetical protein
MCRTANCRVSSESSNQIEIEVKIENFIALRHSRESKQVCLGQFLDSTEVECDVTDIKCNDRTEDKTLLEQMLNKILQKRESGGNDRRLYRRKRAEHSRPNALKKTEIFEMLQKMGRQDGKAID